jgi:hypothetical protein
VINARVNEKLYAAKLALNAAEQADGAMQSVLLEAAVFHLVTAYRCYLLEITALASTAFTSAIDAATILSAPTADFEELLNLERRSSWLSQLLMAYSAVVAPLPPARPVAAELAVIDVTAQLDVATCRKWLLECQQLIERQREHAQEW